MKSNQKMKSRRLAYFWLALSACFMICIFAPLETYLANISEFWYGYAELVPVCFIVFIVLFLCAWVPFLLLRKTKVFGYFFTFCFCLYIGFYIQGNYVARPYGIFDGRAINWNDPSYQSVSLASILIFGGVLLASILCCKFLRGKIYKVATFACIVVMISQISTLGFLYAKNGDTSTAEQEYVITDNRQFHLSKEKNIIVLLLDTFDGSVMTDLLEEEYGRSLKEDLDGFTFYPDTVGCFPLTKASMPFIFTGTWYNNDIPYADYVQKAYRENPVLLHSLKEAGYTAGVYVNHNEYVQHQPDVYLNVQQGQYRVKDYVRFIKNTYKMVLFNYAPHQLKKRFELDAGNISSNRMLDIEHDIYNDSVPDFYHKFNSTNGFIFDETQPAFRFYHTTGIHQAYTFNEALEEGSGFGIYDEAKGCMTLLRQMIKDLKQEGIYDDTAIIVMADHSDGWRSARGSNPLFMVKNFAETGELLISDLAISYEDFEETICSIIKGQTLPGSIWSNDIKGRTERKFMWYQPELLGNDIKYLPLMHECVIKGVAWDPDSFRHTDKFYDAGNIYYDPDYFNYELGTSVNLRDRNSQKYFEYGLKTNGSSRDKESQMCFHVGDLSDDLQLTVKYQNYFSDVEQRVMLSVNGTSLGEIQSGKPIRISNSLIDEDGMLRLRYAYPDATTSVAQGVSSSTFLYAVYFDELLIERAQ